MLSLDTPEKNLEFAKSLEAKHVLLSDPSGEVAKAYGVVGLGGFFARRWTFYVDASGRILEIDREVSTTSAGQDIARKLGELGFPKRAAAPAPQSSSKSSSRGSFVQRQ